MKGEMEIIDFKEDRGKNQDGRLTISVNQLPSDGIIDFLEWAGNEFINKGGLYAVDIVNAKGIYRGYKDESEKSEWIKEV